MQPDARLIVLAAVLAVATSVVTFSIFRHANESRARRRLGWICLASICAAFGLWSAHIVAQMAHGPAVSPAQASVLTMVSLAAAVVFIGFGFLATARDSGWHPAVGGAISGAGLGTMHYVGAYAFALPGVLELDLPLVLGSLGVGIGLNAMALTAFRRLKGALAVWCAAGLLTLAFLGLHFAAVRAVRAVEPTTAVTAAMPPHWLLVTVLAGAAVIVLVLGVVSILIGRQARRDNVEAMQQLVDAAIEGIVVVKDGRIDSANQRIADLCGVARADLIGRGVEEALLSGPIAEGGEVYLRTGSGARVPVKVARHRLQSGDEILAIHDLTERRATEAELQRRNKALQEREEELRARNLLLDTALKHMSQGLCMYDKDERVVVCNERYATVYGLAPDAVKAGMTRREVVQMRIAHGLWAGASAEGYLHQRSMPITTTGHVLQELSDGRTISLVHVPMPGGGWVCTHEDITERRQAQARIEHLARHDTLTDLPNRVLLREELQDALARMRPGEGLAVLYADLDRFQEVNDALGLAHGDELLQDFSARLRRHVGETDLLARIGGDEFIIVKNPALSPTDATDLANEIIAELAEPFVLGEPLQVVLGASIGIAMAPGDGSEADQLIKNANLALNRAKAEERGHYRFFEQEMDARMRARHELERNLRSALANGELDLDYQPLLNLKRNEISCFEALLRWRTADGELIPPGEFVPLAEETGLIVAVGEWALRQALAEAVKWPRQIRVAVNLSPVQFNSRNLAQVVMSALAASGLEANRLELEITESLLLQERETTLATLHQLRDLGVRIALDDFGTGFSSLNYLRAFPFDKIKIDKCFIAGLAEGNEESLAIVRAVAKLGTSLGIATTAEGVETPLQLDIARREGFTEAQGFWIDTPSSAAVIAAEYDLYKSTRKPRRAAVSGEAGSAPSIARVVSVAARPKRPRKEKPTRSAG